MEAGFPARALVRAALAGQRVRRFRAVVPRSLRRRLKLRLAGWVDRSAGGASLDDWSAPLVPGVRVAPPSPSRVIARPVPEPQAVAADDVAGDGPRCLIATSALDAGGMDEMVAFLARRLGRCGLRIAVLHSVPAGRPERRGRIADVLRAAGVDVVVRSEADGRRWLRDWRPDVISAHGALPWVLDEARRASVPYVDVLHGMHSLFGVDWAAEAERSQHLAAIVAVSEHVRRQYLRGVPTFPPQRIVTIPNGVDDDRRSPMDRDGARAALGLGDEFLFVSLARYCLQKNTYGLVSAFGEVAAEHPDVHLLVAGRADDPVYCAQVKRLRDSLPVGGRRIHLRDHASDPGLILSAADGFVLDSFFEGWALASMEALHAGVPVVASDVGGAREQIGDNGDRGYVVGNPLGDPVSVDWERMGEARYTPQVNREELITAMGLLVSNRARWAAAREALAAESAERFHPDACADQHAVLLRSLGERSRINARAA
jgi:glycosyltransferase involved in cell wall biosynthesis